MQPDLGWAVFPASPWQDSDRIRPAVAAYPRDGAKIISIVVPSI